MKSIVDRAIARFEGVGGGEPHEAMNLPIAEEDEELRGIVESLSVSIKIVGCGGGGSNTISRLCEAGIVGAQLCAINTDAKHLLHIRSPKKMLIGRRITRGLGAGAIPEIGEKAARESEGEIRAFLQGANVVFVTAGLGGGTGTGSAHVVARLAKETGALVMGVVTMPFTAEGGMRRDNADGGIDKLRRYCDTTAVIENDKLLELVPKLPIEAAFKVADEILMQSIKGMTEIVTRPGLVNIDFSDLMTIIEDGGVAMIGMGEGGGETDRIDVAVAEALESPLLGEVNLSQVGGALIRVVGGTDLTVSEAERAAELIGDRINSMARIIWGCSVDPNLKEDVRVLVVLTGVEGEHLLGKETGHIVEGEIDLIR
ncbi:MAG: cell division protein FtsZ [Thermoplasmata archaeon]